jgi:hypothetical protein
MTKAVLPKMRLGHLGRPHPLVINWPGGAFYKRRTCQHSVIIVFRITSSARDTRLRLIMSVAEEGKERDIGAKLCTHAQSRDHRRPGSLMNAVLH